jgi:hypothetical protein
MGSRVNKNKKLFYKLLRRYWARSSLPRKVKMKLNNKHPNPHPEVTKIPN